MKAIEFYAPGVNLSAISAECLLRFAETHHDENGIIAAENPDMLNTLQMTFIRVVKHETGIRFSFLETEDGNYAVYLPDAWHPMPYDQILDSVMPYLAELVDPYMRNLESVMLTVSYD